MKTYISSLFLLLSLFTFGLAQEDGADTSGGLESLKATAKAFIEAEDRGDWNRCYALLAKPIREGCALEAFSQRMRASVAQKQFIQPHISFASVNRTEGLLGRVIIVETAPPIPKTIRVVAIEAISSDEGWRIVSITGSAATNLIDDVFFSRRMHSPK